MQGDATKMELRAELDRLLRQAVDVALVEDAARQLEWASEVKVLLDAFLGPSPINIHSESYYAFDHAKSHGERVAVLRAVMRIPDPGTKLGPVRTGRPSGRQERPAGRSRVFLVHGRDAGTLSTVARLLERIGLDVVILHEQPSAGRTIIEKFVDYSDVEYAVVLLTPDDRGGLATVGYEQQRYRARQNVLFEFGFFVGKLGRDRVCALYDGTVEVPSDYSGVVFVPLDAQGAWRTVLAAELRSAGIGINLDGLLS